MTLVAVTGHCATTTALAVASCWPTAADPIIVAEGDPRGGSLAAWLGLPARPGLADLAADAHAATWEQFLRVVVPTPAGLDVATLPARAHEAHAVTAALAPVWPSLCARAERIVLVDAGPLRHASDLTAHADAVLAVHRQHAGSAAAAAVGIERVRESVDRLPPTGIAPTVALIGDRPYRVDEVARHLGVHVIGIPVDPWAADVLAGRRGAASRLRRAPLMTAARAIAAHLATLIETATDGR